LMKFGKEDIMFRKTKMLEYLHMFADVYWG